MTTTEPAQRACPDWLDLRAAADAQARDEGAQELLASLVAALRDRSPSGAGGVDEGSPTVDPATVRIVDVGAGTGANRRYLSPRLPFEQQWVAVDHDPELLAHPGNDGSRRVCGSVQDLVEVLASLDAEDGPLGVPTVVVATAVLDVFTTADLGTLADCVAATGGAALLSLSVTGAVRWEPADPEDHLLSTAFDGHQRRGGRPGPDAPAVLGALLEERGLRVRAAQTPWDLPGGAGEHRELLERWMDERVQDAVAHDPSSAPVLAGWHRRRRDQLASGVLRVLVDHVDLLVLGVRGPDGVQPGA